jgi:hypothetical protein
VAYSVETFGLLFIKNRLPTPLSGTSRDEIRKRPRLLGESDDLSNHLLKHLQHADLKAFLPD